VTVDAILDDRPAPVHDNTEHATLGIERVGRASTGHSLRRTIRSYPRLCNSPWLRSLVEAAVATVETSEQIAECLNREGFRPVSEREERLYVGNGQRGYNFFGQFGTTP